MQGSADVALWLALWLVAAMAILSKAWKGASPGVGLLLAYVLNLWLIHWVAAVLYLLPWYQNFEVDTVALGLEQSTYGILAFALGSLVLTPIVQSFRHHPYTASISYASHQNLPKAYLLIGTVSYLLLPSTLGRVPTASALIGVGQQLFVVGLCLACWQAWHAADMRRFLAWLGVGLLMPLITIASRGFIGYGAIATFTLLMFIVSFYRPRWHLVFGVLLVGYVGLSFYVSYMRDRNDIREVVWGGKSWSDRLEQVGDTLRSVEWFDPLDEAHLRRIDERLNQDYLVGAAISSLQC
jgi:hypothetical protein